MFYESRWLASEKPEILSGQATFKVGGKEYTLNLDSYADYRKIHDMLLASSNEGRQIAKASIERAIHNAL